MGIASFGALLIGFVAALGITRAWVFRRLKARTLAPIQGAGLVAAMWGSLPFLFEFLSDRPFNLLAAAVGAVALALGSGAPILLIGNRLAKERNKPD